MRQKDPGAAPAAVRERRRPPVPTAGAALVLPLRVFPPAALPPLRAYARGLPWACDVCGSDYEQWQSRCPRCLSEFSLLARGSSPGVAGGGADGGVVLPPGTTAAAGTVSAGEVIVEDVQRLRTGLPRLDAVLGGGWPLRTVTLIGGEGGSAKSTLALTAMQRMRCVALFGNGEMDVRMVIRLAKRAGTVRPGARILAAKDVRAIFAAAEEVGARFVAFDSAQRLIDSEHPEAGREGSTSQIHAVLTAIQVWAREKNRAALVISHLTTEGEYKGGTDVRYDPDVLLRLERLHGQHRRLYVEKSRIGLDRGEAFYTLLGDGPREGQLVELSARPAAPQELAESPKEAAMAEAKRAKADAAVRAEVTGLPDDVVRASARAKVKALKTLGAAAARAKQKGKARDDGPSTRKPQKRRAAG